jgi:DNA-binding IclR family transcriptional regulator
MTIQNIRMSCAETKAAIRATKTLYHVIRERGRIPFRELYETQDYTPAQLTELIHALQKTGLVDQSYDKDGKLVICAVLHGFC